VAATKVAIQVTWIVRGYGRPRIGRSRGAVYVRCPYKPERLEFEHIASLRTVHREDDRDINPATGGASVTIRAL
jgi:hypothetical protein